MDGFWVVGVREGSVRVEWVAEFGVGWRKLLRPVPGPAVRRIVGRFWTD